MNLYSRIAISLLLIATTALFSCEKSASEMDYGISKIYMPQAIFKSGGVGSNYPVPSGTDSSTYNYTVNTTDSKVEVILGAALSGPGSDAYSIDIAVNNDTVQQLFNTKTLDTALYKLMPASMYTLPAYLDVPAGSKSGTFNLSIDIPKLKLTTYVGKFLVLAVKLKNSTKNPVKYELNNAISTTIVIVDVNALVIGPAVNITGTYIKNSGNPFIANGFMTGQTRWGNLRDWSTNAAARSHGGFGGFSSDNGGTMNMESGWGSPQILNGKIYQTITSLPAGSYAFDIAGSNWTGAENFLKDPGYTVVALNVDTLPDYSSVATNNAIRYQLLAKPTQPYVNFELTAPTKVTVGVVINYNQTEQGFKSKQVFLYSYPKHL